MSNNESFFIEDRVRSLAYEARRFPVTADAALAWMGRARRQALKQGNAALAGCIMEVERSLWAA